MLFETLEYYENLPRCPKYLLKYEALQESIAIKARHKRCAAQWKSHLENTKDFINKNICLSESALRTPTTIIAGAGSANDLDLFFLSDNCDKIILTDLFFLKADRKHLSTYPNLLFSEFDISDQMQTVLEITKQCGKEKDNLIKLLHKFVEQRKSTYNFKQHPLVKLATQKQAVNIISLNLLSQIPLNFSRLFEKILKNSYTEEDFLFFFRNLITEHLALLSYLKKLNTNIILITDTYKYLSGKKGKEIHQESSLFEVNLKQYLPPIKEERSWYWDLAPFGEFSKNYSVKLSVKACKV